MTRNTTLPPDPMDELRRNLERLRLKVMLAGLDAALDEATRSEQSYATFLAALVQLEMLARNDGAAERRIKAARFPATKTFDEFDWNFQPGLNVLLVKDLMTLRFVGQGRPVLMLGKPGTGKSHMSIALGTLAAQRGHSVRFYTAPKLVAQLYAAMADSTVDRLIEQLARIDLLIIDDLRQMAVKLEHACLLFELIEMRSNRKATIISSNLPLSGWGAAVGAGTLAAPMIDRLMERSLVLNIKKGRSWRTEGPEAPPEDDRPLDCTPDGEDA